MMFQSTAQFHYVCSRRLDGFHYTATKTLETTLEPSCSSRSSIWQCPAIIGRSQSKIALHLFNLQNIIIAFFEKIFSCESRETLSSIFSSRLQSFWLYRKAVGLIYNSGGCSLLIRLLHQEYARSLFADVAFLNYNYKTGRSSRWRNGAVRPLHKRRSREHPRT